MAVKFITLDMESIELKQRALTDISIMSLDKKSRNRANYYNHVDEEEDTKTRRSDNVFHMHRLGLWIQ